MSQNYSNHTRWLVPYHFVVAPLLIADIAINVRAAIRAPGAWPVWGAVVSIAIFLGIALGRMQALTVQNRLIRLEETLRLQRLLPAEAHAAISALDVRQLVALRFASDAELPALFARVRNGEFADSKAIKMAITNWRPDMLRV